MIIKRGCCVLTMTMTENWIWFHSRIAHNIDIHFIICSFSKFLKIKMIFFIKSWVYIKNVILWCISCYCSSKKEKTGGGQKSYNCSFWAPSNFLDFWASRSWCASKKHIFYVEIGFWQKEINLRLKKLKKVTFQNSTSSCCWKW